MLPNQLSGRINVEVMPEQQTSSLTANSRRFKEVRDRIEKLPTPDSHVNGENGAKTMVYNMKRNSKKRGRKKNKEKERFKKYNSKKGKL